MTDISSDLALAFLVEKKQSRKIALREALRTIDRVQAELESYLDDPGPARPALEDKVEVNAPS